MRYRFGWVIFLYCLAMPFRCNAYARVYNAESIALSEENSMARLGIALVLLVGSSLSAGERAITDKTAAIEEALENLTEVQYLDTPIADVVDDLELRHRINIELDAETLAAFGLGTDLPLTKTLKGIPLASALDLLLGGQGLAWVIHNDVLLITTAENERKYPQTKIYVVDDLDENPEVIGNIIVQSLAPDTWRNNDGELGSLAPYEKGKALVITHTTRMHRQIAKLLGDLRAAEAKTKK
jgi:hypothetical protein